MNASAPRRSLLSERSAGTALIIAALAVNPWTIGMLFAPDGSIDGEARVRLIVLADTFAILAGMALVWTSPRRILREFVPNIFAATALVAALSLSIVGSWWGITAYRGAHHHTMEMRGMKAPSVEERQWADDFVQRCLQSARDHGWFDFDKARADGFELQWDDREHYLKREFLFDDKILDPDRPEFLMFQKTPRGQLLMGFMFFGRTLEERGPQPGGSITAWHFHPWGPRGYCAEGGILPMSRPDNQGHCVQGVHVTRSAEMLHVWFVDHPLGPYADAMLFPDPDAKFKPTLIHPMVVHFTIALVIIGVALDLAGKIFRKSALHTAAFVNLLIAGPFAVAAIAAGMFAEVQLVIGHDVHEILDTHKLLGFSALGAIVVLVAWRVWQRGRFPATLGWLYLAVGIGAAVLTGGAGYFGSELVYNNGVAVQAIDRQALERHERAVFGGELKNLQMAEPTAAAHMHGNH